MEKILAFHLPEPEIKKLQRIAASQKIRLHLVEPGYALTPLGVLADGRPPKKAPCAGEPFPESLLVLCDFSEKRMDRLLAALRKNQVKIDYKAALTPINRSWNVLRLMPALRAERESLECPPNPLSRPPQ